MRYFIPPLPLLPSGVQCREEGLVGDGGSMHAILKLPGLCLLFFKDIAPLEAVFGKAALDIDPLRSLHPVETFESKKNGSNSTRKYFPLVRLRVSVHFRDV